MTKVHREEKVICPVIESDKVDRDIKLKGILGSSGWMSKESFAVLQMYSEGDAHSFIKHDKEDDVFEIVTKTGKVWLIREEFELAQKYQL